MSVKVLSLLKLFVQHRIFGLNNVHLQHCPDGIFLSWSDANLLAMVLKFSHHVVYYLLKVIHVAPHRELVFAFVTSKEHMLFPYQQVQRLKWAIKDFWVDGGSNLDQVFGFLLGFRSENFVCRRRNRHHIVRVLKQLGCLVKVVFNIILECWVHLM